MAIEFPELGEEISKEKKFERGTTMTIDHDYDHEQASLKSQATRLHQVEPTVHPERGYWRHPPYYMCIIFL